MSNSNNNRQLKQVKRMLKALGKPKSFHAANLEHIKKIAKASYVGFENYKDYFHVKVIRNDFASYFKLHGTPNDMTQDSYDKLLELIILGKTKEDVLLGKLGSNDGV